ncbi:hypothetical protein GGI07_001974 [Coemansia sp. Benny D115]|nr:hypothetical protein GGI07_001974 [Coemansia sp. Benny D115]
MRRVSATGIANARETACSSYARPIRREVEETSRFLSTLSINPPTRTLGAVSSPSDYDPAVAGTLERVDQLRKDFERKLREEKEAERRKIEERARAEREKKRLAEEAAKKAVEDAKKAEEEKQAQARAKIEAAEQKKKAEKEAKEAAEAAAKEAAKEAAAKEAQLEKSKQVSPDALEWAARYRSMYRQLMDGLAVQVKNNKTAKAYCFKQRGLVTRSIGQLKDSMAYVNRIANTIAQVLREASEQQGEEAHQWMLNLVAKGLVKQAETEVSVAQHAAYPLAATAVLLMQQYPLLVDMVLIRLVKKCPYVIPQYIARTPSQSQEEYLRSIGYKEKEEGELESEGIYCERMAGMLALYAAILQTPQLANKPNPLPVSHAWAWLARMINMPPRSISPLLVQTFLSIAGTSMAAAYGKQFTKVMDVLSTAWIPSIADSSPSAIAAKSNIRGFVDEYFASGIINGCEGRVIKP